MPQTHQGGPESAERVGRAPRHISARRPQHYEVLREAHARAWLHVRRGAWSRCKQKCKTNTESPVGTYISTHVLVLLRGLRLRGVASPRGRPPAVKAASPPPPSSWSPSPKSSTCRDGARSRRRQAGVVGIDTGGPVSLGDDAAQRAGVVLPASALARASMPRSTPPSKRGLSIPRRNDARRVPPASPPPPALPRLSARLPALSTRSTVTASTCAGTAHLAGGSGVSTRDMPSIPRSLSSATSAPAPKTGASAVTLSGRTPSMATGTCARRGSSQPPPPPRTRASRLTDARRFSQACSCTSVCAQISPYTLTRSVPRVASSVSGCVKSVAPLCAMTCCGAGTIAGPHVAVSCPDATAGLASPRAPVPSP